MTTETRDLFNKLHEDRVDSARTLEKRSMRGLKASVVDKYSDQAHFIYELIQNADDVGATFVSFSLYNDRLEFVHNGKRHFNITDVDNETEDSNNGTLGDLNAITSIANSNKTDASIGKFGVGFKAVFQYTNEPRIYDPLVSFKIERFIVPVLIEDDYEGRKPDETVFVFPFNHSERPASVAFEDILYKMQNLVFPTLFLNNLKTIYYKCDSKSISGVYRKDTIKSCVVDDVIAEKLELTNGMDSKKDILWLFSQTTHDKFKYSCGFFLDDAGKLKITHYAAFCFFPTKKNTNLHFIINAPFLLTDSREGIKAGDAHNKRMISLLSKLASKCFPILRDFGLEQGNLIIDDDILDFIPTNKNLYIPENERDEISFVSFYNDIRDVFKVEKIWPSFNEYACAKDGYLAFASIYCDLFSNDQLKELCHNPNTRWIIPSISFESFSRARKSDASDARLNYIVDEMGISNLRDTALLSKIDKEFMSHQSWEWIIKLYEFIIGTKERIEKCRDIPVLFDQYDNPAAAYDEYDNAILFVDDSSSEGYATISHKLTENKTALELIKSLDIHAPELKDKIFNKILKKTKLDAFSDFKNILDYYIQLVESDDDDGQWTFENEIYSEIEEKDFIRCINPKGDVSSTAPKFAIYYPTQELKYYFDGYSDVQFVDLDFYISRLNNKERRYLEEFLQQLTVGLHVFVLSDSITEKEANRICPKTSWPRSTRAPEWIDRKLHACEFVLKKIKDNNDIQLSVILWNELVAAFEYSNPIRLDYKGYYYSPFTTPYPNTQSRILKESAWLYDKHGNLLSAAELTCSMLSPEYDVSSSEAKRLLAFLGIEDDSIDYSAYDDETAEKLRTFESYNSLGVFDRSPEEIAKALEMYDQNKETGAEHAEGNSKETEENTPGVSEIQIIDDIKSRVRKKSTSDRTSETKPHKIDEIEQDNEELLTATVDFTQRKEQMKEKFEEDIAKLAQIENAQNTARNSRKYSYLWFKSLLFLESIASGDDTSRSREVSINFSKAERDLESNRTIILKHPDKNIPMVMEQLVDIPMTITFSDGKTKRLIIDAANVQSYSLRVKVKHEDSLADIDYESINSINITAKSPAFLTQSLIEEFGKFADSPFEFDDDYDMQGNLCENISFIFGPPGTGKTTYLANNTLIPLVRQNDKVRILVLAPTNKAADVLVSKIIDSMGKDHSYEKWLVRYGITSDEKIEESPVFKGKDFEIEDYKKCVIVTTMARLPYDYFIDSKGNFNFLHGINWDYIVVDEASMIPLVYMVYMLYLKTPKQFIIAGDPFQIEPTTSVSEWKSENIYKMVHLEDFSENAETVPYRYDIKLLTTQYRSIEDVGDVFSRFTYKGILKHNRSNDSARKLNIEEYLDYEHLNIIKFPVSQYESIYKAKKLKSSNYQVYSALFVYEFAVYISKAIALKNPVDKFSIGIIAPYSAEAGLIDKLLSYADISPRITISASTIHGFQGDECDIIIALFNPPPYISTNREIFLNKQNVVNVAISRARDYLFILVPDENTRNVQDLFLLEKLKSIVRRHDISENESDDIEEALFGNKHYIEDNAFSTGHQLVNVYGMPERRYEVRSEDAALDVQVHGKSKYVELNEELPEPEVEDPIQAPESHTKPVAIPKSKIPASSYQPVRTQPQAQPQVITPSIPSVSRKPNTADTMSVDDYRAQFPVGCRIEYSGLGKGTVVMNHGNYFVVDFDTSGKKPLNPSNCMKFELITRCNDEQK